MGSLLWSQNSKSTKVSRFVIDGILSTYESREYQDLAYSFLSKEASKIKLTRNYPRIHIYNKGIFIEGYFNEKDESGRQMTYMFFHPDKNIDVATELLISYSKLIGCSVDSSIKDKLLEEYNKGKNRTMMIVIISVVSFFVMSTILLILNKLRLWEKLF